MTSESNEESRARDEQRPLLDGREGSRQAPADSGSIVSRLRRTVVSSFSFRRSSHDDDADDNDGDFDSNDLVRHRSRLSSYPSVPDPEALERFRSKQSANDGPVAAVTEQSNSTEEPVVQGAGDGAAGASNEAADAIPDSKGKYIGVSTLRFWLIFLTILLGYFVACFDITLMASSHPVITSYFDASESASWLTTVFMITNTGFQPLWGRLSDTVGRKSVYLFVLTIFGLTNLWCALSGSITSFIAARAFCGLGAGGTMSLGLVILNDLVYVEYRGVYISHVNLAFGLGSACGAAFGGLLCDSLGWRWSFGLQVPVLGVCIIAAFFTTPTALGPMLMRASIDKSKGERSAMWQAIRTFDYLGVITLVFTVTFLILFLNLGGNVYPWTHWLVVLSLVFAVTGSVALVWVEKRAENPVMPLKYLTQRPVANLVYSNFLAGIASNTVLFNVPLWFQAVKLTSATTSGLLLAAPSIGGSAAGVSTGYIITYTQRLKPTLLFGAIVYLAGSSALCTISTSSSTAASLALITGAPLAQGFVYPSSMMSAFSVSTPADQAVVTTAISLWRNLGIVVGVAVSSLVFQNALRRTLENTVRGPDRDAVIRRARTSVRSIKHLPVFYRDQVITAYAASLKMTFITAVVASALLLVVVAFCKLPRLRRRAMHVSAGE